MGELVAHGPPVEKRRRTSEKETAGGETPEILPPVPPVHFEAAYLTRPAPPQAEYDSSSAASAAALAQYQREGFLVIRGLLDASEIDHALDRLQLICDRWQQGIRPGQGLATEAPITPLVDFDTDFLLGARAMPEEPIDAVRRFFRLAVHDEHFKHLVSSPKLLCPLRQLWGEDVAVLQSMALCKPPGTGEKRWHADMGYFRLKPAKVAAFWIALDDTTVENGCMFVQPRSHLRGTPRHEVPALGVDGRPMMENPKKHIFYSACKKPPVEEVFAVPLAPGDALLFDGDLLHFTPPNTTNCRRRALQFHYAAAECVPTTCPGGAEAAKAPNEVFGARPRLEVAQGFDCAPGGRDCIEPQYWYYRKAEMIVSGKRPSDTCI